MTDFIDVAVTPAEARAMVADCFIVVDVLRATTTIATLFANGVADMIVVDDIDAARNRAKSEGRVLFGEVGGLPPEGFDHGNSPLEASRLRIGDQGAVLFTTNGTKALCELSGRGTVVAGAPANATAVAAAAAGFARVAIVCAGSDGGSRFALDDFAAAAVIGRALLENTAGARLGDAAKVALQLVETSVGGLAGLLRESHHGRLLASIGLAADIEFCSILDSSHAVPAVVRAGAGWAVLERLPGASG